MKRLLPALLVCACVLPNDVVGVTGADGGFGGGGTGSDGGTSGGTAFAPSGTASDDTAGTTAMPPEPESCTVGVCTCMEPSCSIVCDPIVEDTPCAMVCGAGQECWFDCPEGGCEFVCEVDAICHLDCPGGGCTMNCVFSDLCEMDCNAEPDAQPCSGTCSAETCNINCPVGGCSLECFEGTTECSTTSCEAECSVACNNVTACEGSCQGVNAECPPY